MTKKEPQNLTSLNQIRALVMTLTGVEEGPPVRAARRIAAFKVAGKSFLGIENGEVTMTVSLDAEQAKALAAAHPAACEEIWRNHKTILGLRLELSKLPRRKVFELIKESWRFTAGAHSAAIQARHSGVE